MADPIRRTLDELRAAGAPSFFERDPSVLKAAFKTRFEEVSGRTLFPAQTEMFLIEIAAYVLSVLHEAAQTATIQNTAVFAQGRHLDNRGANVSTFRLLAQPAKTTLAFSLVAAQPAEVGVPKGTRVAAGTAVIFSTDADLLIPAGAISGSVTATAQAPGAQWNGLGVGVLNDILDPVPLVREARNTVVVSGGTDEEDEERFRLRVVNSLFTIAKTGPRNGYRELVKAVDPEILDVAVIRPEPGRVDIYPLMRDGAPSAILKDAILAWLDPELRRPMGDDVFLLDPVRRGFTFAVTVRALTEVPGLQAAAEAAVRDTFAQWSRELGAQIAPSTVIAAVRALANVTDVATNLAFTDLQAAEYAGIDALTVSVSVRPNV